MHSWILVILAVDGALLVGVFAQLSRIERRLGRLEKRAHSKKRSSEGSGRRS